MGSNISDKHTFVVCAYKTSPYLEECVCSVLNQNYKSTVMIATSTPNRYIEEVAEKYGLKLCINTGVSSLADDWNFALSCANTELVTLAHQDDIYETDYSKEIWRFYNKSRSPIILFSDYCELRDGVTVEKNQLLKIKRMMLSPLKLSALWGSRFIRRRILSLGSAICCPAVTVVRSAIPMPLFENNMKSNIDWQAWELLSRKKGSFVYVPHILMKHRIHAESTTSELIGKSARKEEDLKVFRKFWPAPIAKCIEFIYQKGEKSNKLCGENNNHTFAICAYKESPYLEECIISLTKQTIKSNIIIITSTPNQHIERLANQYDIPYIINSGQSGITQDWNFAYAHAKTKYITITHQDDIYDKDYLATAIQLFERVKKPLIFFCNYYEIRNGKRIAKNRLLEIKRIMLSPLRIKCFWNIRWIRRRILSLGSPICCPSVMFAAENLPDVIFKNGFRACEDWEAWEALSKLKGAFVYSPQLLMGHRIHEGSETSAIIGDNKRSEEEYQMYCKFWPAWFARILERLYAKGQESNEL